MTGFSQPKPIQLESPPRGEEHKKELEIIHEDPSAVDESAIMQNPLDLKVEVIKPISPPAAEALVHA